MRVLGWSPPVVRHVCCRARIVGVCLAPDSVLNVNKRWLGGVGRIGYDCDLRLGLFGACSPCVLIRLAKGRAADILNTFPSMETNKQIELLKTCINICIFHRINSLSKLGNGCCTGTTAPS